MSDEQGASTLSVTDNRTGRVYEIPITDGAISATALRQIKHGDDDFGLLSYDPAFMNTASCRSAITFIDGDKGILRYRGYPIQELAQRVSFLDVASLLLEGELPAGDARDQWIAEVTHHTFVHENVKKFIDGFHHDAHPMGILVGTVGALSTFYPDAKRIDDPADRRRQAVRLIGKISTLAAFAYRHARGLPYAYPDNELSYAGNFLSMMWKMSEPRYQPDPVLEHALDVLFILHADHEQNCSTNAMRAVGSSRVDPYSAAAAAVAALYGPLHGGANEQVLRMLDEIGSVDQVPAYVERVKRGEFRLMGFGHRVYKNYDPRATIIKQVADEVFKVTGLNPKLEIAVELERIALEDQYFVDKKLYPNVDFYSGIIYEAMGFPVEMFPVLFAIGRMPGWLAQWEENLNDPEQKIARPRQIYVGRGERHIER
jgi:citrate synthase